MKYLIVGVDINRATADPSMYFKPESYEYRQSLHLDETASRIAEFNLQARKFAPITYAINSKILAPVTNMI